MKIKKNITHVLSALVGLMLVNSGISKFTNHMPMELPEAATNAVEAMIAMGWLWPLVAIVEILGGLLFIIPKTRTLGALMLLPIIVGILLFNIALSPSTAIMGVVLLLVNSWVLWENRERLNIIA